MRDAADINVDKKARIMKSAAGTALAGNAVLAVAKVAVGLSSGSLAVTGDGIDTAIDVLVAVMQLVIAGVMAKPADPCHPWGHGRAETVGTAFLAFLLFFAGFQLVTQSALGIISGTAREAPGMTAVIVTLVSIAGKLLLALNQKRAAKEAASGLLAANARNMAADAAVSAGVLIGLVLSILFGVGLADSVAAMLVGLWVIKSAIGIFAGANSELMDGGARDEQYLAVFEAVRSVEGALNPHRTRIRRIAGFLDIDIDIEVDGRISVREAHVIATRVETAIRSRLENVFDIMVHVEPAGDAADAEAYGLSEESIR